MPIVVATTSTGPPTLVGCTCPHSPRSHRATGGCGRCGCVGRAETPALPVCVLCLEDVNPAADAVDCGDGPEHVGCHETDVAHLVAELRCSGCVGGGTGATCRVCGGRQPLAGCGHPAAQVTVLGGCYACRDLERGYPADVEGVGSTDTLASVLAAGVEPTEVDMVRARKRVGGQTEVRAVFAFEAGVAGAVGEELANLVRRGDAVGVARCIRSLLASAAAGSERVDQILGAPGGGA